MSIELAEKVARPDHVPHDRVVEFDFFDLPGLKADAQGAFHQAQKALPAVFWTPYNGGHWVAMRAREIDSILRNPEIYSSDRVFLPVENEAPRSIPVEIDAPQHGQYRKPLNRALFPKIVDSLEPGIRKLTNDLIDTFIARGSCEFMSEFAQVFPISIFLDLVGLPRDERHWLVPVAHQFSHSPGAVARAEAQAKIFDFLRDTVRTRRAAPEDDLLSVICNAEVDGERIDEDNAIAFATLVLFGGLDTVASMLGFFTKFLATNPRHRQQLIDRIDDEAFVKGAIEELFRRHGLVNAARRVNRDTELDGVSLKKGDMILPPNMLLGLDPDLVDDPLTVDFERGSSRHAAFGQGPHMCPGAHLARRELKVFLEEWLRRIPEFTITPGTEPVITMHVAATVEKMEICWPVSNQAG